MPEIHFVAVKKILILGDIPINAFRFTPISEEPYTDTRSLISLK